MADDSPYTNHHLEKQCSKTVGDGEVRMTSPAEGAGNDGSSGPQKQETDPHDTKFSSGYDVRRNYTDNITLLTKQNVWANEFPSMEPASSRSEQCVLSLFDDIGNVQDVDGGILDFSEGSRASCSTLVAHDSVSDVDKNENNEEANGQLRNTADPWAVPPTTRNEFSVEQALETESDVKNFKWTLAETDCNIAKSTISDILKNLDNQLTMPTCLSHDCNENKYFLRLIHPAEEDTLSPYISDPGPKNKITLPENSPLEFHSDSPLPFKRHNSYDEAMKIDFINIVSSPCTGGVSNLRSGYNTDRLATRRTIRQKKDGAGHGLFSSCMKFASSKKNGGSKKTRIHVDELDFCGKKVKLPKASDLQMQSAPQQQRHVLSSREVDDGLTEVPLAAEDPTVVASRTVLVEPAKAKKKWRFCSCINDQ